jgi:pantothenate kinase
MHLALLGPVHDLVEPRLERAEAAAVAVGRTGRVLVGIVGAPGSGKSTLAEALAARLARELEPRFGPRSAVAVPMDGFHLSNVELDRLGLAGRKGAPETFDAVGFVHLVRRLRSGTELVYAPAYSRTLHESIGGVIPVPPAVRVVVLEGNYLLVPDEPWGELRSLLDLSVYVEVAAAARLPGLLRRQRSRGLDDRAARDWVERSDEVNTAIVATTQGYADTVLARP